MQFVPPPSLPLIGGGTDRKYGTISPNAPAGSAPYQGEVRRGYSALSARHPT